MALTIVSFDRRSVHDDAPQLVLKQQFFYSDADANVDDSRYTLRTIVVWAITFDLGGMCVGGFESRRCCTTHSSLSRVQTSPRDIG